MAAVPKNIIGSTLRRLRIEQDLTQDALAARCQLQGWDLSRGTLSKIEAGIRRVNDAEILMLSKTLKVEIADLFPARPRLLQEVLRHSDP